MEFEKFKLELNRSYDCFIYVMYYHKWKGYLRQKEK